MVRLNQPKLPLKDLFINQELEFGLTLQNIKTAFEILRINPAFDLP